MKWNADGMKSIRKPYNDRAGYVASRHSCIIIGGWMVIYSTAEAGIDSDKRYAVVCETHNTMVTLNSLPGAREIMVSAEFCEDCQEYLQRIGV